MHLQDWIHSVCLHLPSSAHKLTDYHLCCDRSSACWSLTGILIPAPWHCFLPGKARIWCTQYSTRRTVVTSPFQGSLQGGDSVEWIPHCYGAPSQKWQTQSRLASLACPACAWCSSWWQGSTRCTSRWPQTRCSPASSLCVLDDDRARTRKIKQKCKKGMGCISQTIV